MSMSDLWMDAVEFVENEFIGGAIDFTDAVKELIRIGFDQQEALDHMVNLSGGEDA